MLCNRYYYYCWYWKCHYSSRCQMYIYEMIRRNASRLKICIDFHTNSYPIFCVPGAVIGVICAPLLFCMYRPSPDSPNTPLALISAFIWQLTQGKQHAAAQQSFGQMPVSKSSAWRNSYRESASTQQISMHCSTCNTKWRKREGNITNKCM